MVWWVENTITGKISGQLSIKSLEDRIQQTVNIMFDCCADQYNKFDLIALRKSGVNIFNVDLTNYGLEYFNQIKKLARDAEVLDEIHPSKYNTIPIAVSVTMSIDQVIDIDDEVDIVILKDLTKATQLREFRKRMNEKFTSMPILFWPSKQGIEDFNELIKISDGMILKHMDFANYGEIMKTCKEFRKSVFYYNDEILTESFNERDIERKLLSALNDIVNRGIDGIILKDPYDNKPTELIRSIVKACTIVNDLQPALDKYLDFSVKLATPLLLPYTVAVSTSLAAVCNKANAIIVITTSGASAKLLSCAKPPCIILAITSHEYIVRRLHLYRRVMPIFYNRKRASSWQRECLSRIRFGTSFGLDTGLFGLQAKLVVLAPSEEGIGHCDGFRITTVSEMFVEVHSSS